MEIKQSNTDQTIGYPQQKLKFFSYIDQLQSTSPLLPITPQRQQQKWIVDPWDNHNQFHYSSSQRRSYIDQMVEKYEKKAFRLRKVEIHSERINKSKIETPLKREKKSSSEKENRSISRLYPRIKPNTKIESSQIEKGPFKVPIQSFIYPVIKQQCQKLKEKTSRIERFHLFIARSIKK